MSDVEEGRPLTRREIRLREMASGTLQIEETPSPEPVLEASASEVVSSEQSAEQAAALTPRQQRKLLRMQERKQARQKAADESHGTADDSHDTADDSHDQLLEGQSPTANADPVPNSASQARSEVLAAAIAAIEIPLHDEHGQLRSRRELRELRDQAEADLRASFGTDAPSDPDAATQTDAAVHTDTDVNTEAALAVEDDLVDDDFVDDDFVDDDTEDPGLEAAEQADDSADIDDSDDIETDLGDIETDLGDIETDLGDIETDLDETDQVNVVQVVDVVNDADPALGTQVPEPKTEIPTYTFPDISPIDEAPSVFGDPALRMIRSDAQGAEPEADFDDLIARAVVQEGAASPTNTSALILPSMPEDSLLSAPVQATGEILFTGSITLPRTLSETGSHLSAPDVAHDDHHGVIDELHASDPTITTGHMAPVSAVRAVSAQASTNSLVSNTPTDKSKMPLILISAGGALVLVAAGLVIWAAATGLFG